MWIKPVQLLNFILPSVCVSCGAPGSSLCKACLCRCIRYAQTEFLAFRPYTLGLSVFCIFDYREVPRRCIARSKYAPRAFESLRILAEAGVDTARSYFDEFSPDFMISVPISAAKYKERGFNHSEIIAKVYADRFKIPLLTKVLIRSKNTRPQFECPKRERMYNVRGAFACRCPDMVKNKKILIVDDVCTSGATFLSIAEVLYELGAREVAGLALCRKLLVS